MGLQDLHDTIHQMSDRDLLEAIWASESAYKDGDSEDRSHDHRQHLSRNELERVYILAQRRFELSAARPR